MSRLGVGSMTLILTELAARGLLPFMSVSSRFYVFLKMHQEEVHCSMTFADFAA